MANLAPQVLYVLVYECFYDGFDVGRLWGSADKCSKTIYSRRTIQQLVDVNCSICCLRSSAYCSMYYCGS